MGCWHVLAVDLYGCKGVPQFMAMFMPTGWKPNQRFACFYHGVNGVGRGGVGWDDNVHLHFLTYMMLRCCYSFCTSSHIWCYALVCRLALPHIYDATLLYVVLHFLTYMMLRYCMSSCTSSHIWCYAIVCRLALPHIYDATLLCGVGVGWGGMITFIYTSSHIWCYALVCRLALPHIYDATLLYVVLHFLTYMMLRCCNSSCTSSHIWCYALVCRLALPHIFDATLLLFVLHRLSRPLSAEKMRAPLRFLTFPLKSMRVLFKEFALSGKCKTTVICGKKSMTKTANIENVGSINNPPGCLWPCSKAKITWSIINNFCPCLLSAVIHGAARTAIVVCPSSLTTWDPKGIKQSRKLRKAPVVLRHKWLGPTAG